MQTLSPGKSRYFVIFKDDCSGWCEVSFMKSKAEVPALFQKFVAAFKTRHSIAVSILRSDNGGEYTGREFQEWLATTGIRHETSAPYTPQQVKNLFLFVLLLLKIFLTHFCVRMALLNVQIVQ
jgi:transposase InsO family protein